MDYVKYKLVDDYEDYILFSTGKIYSKKTNKFLKPTNAGRGYQQYTLSNEDGRKLFKLHRLLGITFLENYYNLPTIDHIDINAANNNLDNLRWSSYRLQSINKKRKKTNTSGVVGVHYCNRFKCYKARISLGNGKRLGATFSVKDYGKDEAFRLAIEHRKYLENTYYKNII